MTPAATLLTFVLAAGDLLSPAPVGLAEVVERVQLPAGTGSASLHADPLGARIFLKGLSRPAEVAAFLSRPRGSTCPRAEVRGDSVVVRCKTRRFHAVLAHEGDRSTLDVRVLRGLPFADGTSGAPIPFYPPERLGMGRPCPGTTIAGRAECALAAGDVKTAATLFAEARGGPDGPFASLRLGDLAVLSGDPIRAIDLYREVGQFGPFGRLAVARECEQTSQCFAAPESAFDSTALPEPLRTELELRAIRLKAYLGKLGQALRDLETRNEAPAREPPCIHALALCQRLLLAGLEEGDKATRKLALTLTLSIEGVRETGPAGAHLARTAGEAAAALGALRFAANLLSAETPRVPAPDLSRHLARVTDLYLGANDFTRAAVIAEYAESSLEKGVLRTPRWAGLVRRIQEMKRTSEARAQSLAKAAPAPAAEPQVAPNPITPAPELELAREVAEAQLQVERARFGRAEVKP